MALDLLLDAPSLGSVSWSVRLARLTGGADEYARDTQLVLKTASIAKVFLLVEVAAQIQAGLLDAGSSVDRRSVEPVSDSGLWQHLDCNVLTVSDAARLVGTVSDNLASNVLVDLVGLQTVQARAASITGSRTGLLDIVRDQRTAVHPHTLSAGTASDWVDVLGGLARGEIVSPAVSGRVLDWMRYSADLSMVAGGFDLDPLSHGAGDDPGVKVWNKTGTDVGVRADIGVVRGSASAWVYAMIANWDAKDPQTLTAVLDAMRTAGRWIAQLAAKD